ncbi:hypothetical protein NEHOM01_1603 [Nematocida homosporus]|uniref:uncharacterized protein n=1 Tax=Nematocida homosporus TaxID=1912981 RepID=UPI00221F533D|nr:uncharacterized protein NEHOM01_1603 [Nematocida homosporus]KAI5186635.1 hypothetical protein NEHOM01_1603 [Nematocida homosporus]
MFVLIKRTGIHKLWLVLGLACLNWIICVSAGSSTDVSAGSQLKSSATTPMEDDKTSLSHSHDPAATSTAAPELTSRDTSASMPQLNQTTTSTTASKLTSRDASASMPQLNQTTTSTTASKLTSRDTSASMPQLNQTTTSTTASKLTPSNTQNNNETLPPALRFLATKFMFPWAESIQAMFDKGHLKSTYYNALTGITQHVSYRSKISFFEDEGFYTLLFGESNRAKATLVICYLTDLMLIPANLRLDVVVEDTSMGHDNLLLRSTRWPASQLNLSFYLDMLMAYSVLSQNTDTIRKGPDGVVTSHKLFAQNLAFYIYNRYKKGRLDLKQLEDVCLSPDILAKCGRRPECTSIPKTAPLFNFLDEHSLILNKTCLKTLRASPIINYIHPLRTNLSKAKLDCFYDKKHNAFIVTQSEVTSKTGSEIVNLEGKLTFEAATLLCHHRSAQGPKYTVLASNRHFDKFKKIVSRYRSSDNFDDCFTHGSIVSESIVKEAWDNETSRGAVSAFRWPMFIIGSFVSLVNVCFLSSNLVLCFLPIIIIVIGTIVSIMLITYKLSFTTGLTTHRRQQLCIFALLLLLTLIIPSAIIWYYSVSSYGSQNVPHSYIIAAIYLALAVTSILAVLIIRFVTSSLMPNFARRTYWGLYFLSALLALSIPILCLTKQTFDARALFQTHILVVSAALFVAGALIDVFGRWFCKEKANTAPVRSSSSKHHKMIKVFVIGLVIIVLNIAAILTAIHYNLLSENTALIPYYDAAKSLINSL